MNLAGELIDSCASFEWRGPYHALTRVEGDKVEVLRASSDWSDVVGEKQITDMRSNNLADLFPRPRAVLARVMSELEQAAPKKVNGPGL